ncbi:MAG: hypothetical protein ACYTGL_16960 [Planctomycetota bacterium]|jgi:hypothetical protein
MRKRAFAGITVVLAVVIATIFNGGFPGLGTRNGNADEDGTATKVVSSTEPVTPPAQEPPTEPEPPAADKPEEKPAKKRELKVLDILVDGHEYQISIRGKGYSTFPINQIVAVAKETSGNEDGIRVRILRRPSARVVAWSRLYETLEDAGIDKDAIIMPHELFEGE